MRLKNFPSKKFFFFALKLFALENYAILNLSIQIKEP